MSSGVSLLLPALVAFVATWAVTALLVHKLPQWGLLDRPVERSSHTRPTPRGGGLGILAGLALATAAAVVLGLPLPGWGLAVGTLAVATVGFLDDRLGGLPWWSRMLVHVAAAVAVVGPAGGLATLPLPAPLDVPLGALAVPLAVLWVVAVINFVNFMDGIDGITGIQVMVTAAGLAVITAGSGPWLAGALAAACLAFLRFNWQPARIFLGDVGSGALGFLLAAVPFAVDGVTPAAGVLFLGLSLWLFLADCTFTLVRRLTRGERIWQAHRSHLYQRLVKGGWSHGRTAAAIGFGAAALTLLGLWARSSSAPGAWWLAFAAAAALTAGQWWLARRAEARG